MRLTSARSWLATITVVPSAGSDANSCMISPALGTTVIVASHDLALVKRMRRRVLVLDHGRLLDDISPEDLAA